jgi:glycerol kinase
MADLLGLVVERPRFVETTALGAAMLAGIGCGRFESLEAAAAMRGAVDLFEPGPGGAARESRIAAWSRAVRSVLEDSP